MSKKARTVVVIVAILGLAGAAWALVARGGPSAVELEASGTVEATEADLGFAAGGRIEAIAVREGEAVAAGQELARVDAAELRARRDAAAAHVEAAEALLAEMRTGARPEELAQAQAAARAAMDRLEDAHRDVERARELFEGGAISREALDKATTAHEVAQASAEQAAEQLRLVRAGPRAERVAAQEATVRQAQAALAQVESALDNSVIRAPFAGRVTIRHRQPGETVAPGLPVLTLMDPDDRWVRIYVPEHRLGAVALGQPATIRSDTYRDRTYGGEVVFIADQAEFTPRNVQTPEERVRLVYAVKVRITGDPRLELKPGLPADVRLEAASDHEGSTLDEPGVPVAPVHPDAP